MVTICLIIALIFFLISMFKHERIAEYIGLVALVIATILTVLPYLVS